MDQRSIGLSFACGSGRVSLSFPLDHIDFLPPRTLVFRLQKYKSTRTEQAEASCQKRLPPFASKKSTD